MKSSKLHKFSQAGIILSCLMLSTVPAPQVLAQSVDVANAAKGACEDAALNKGFKVVDVVSISPKGTDGADVVLTLSKEGQAYKLTCGYTTKGGAAFAEDLTQSVASTVGAVTTPTIPMNWGPLWWLLLPIIGLPLLLAWVGNRRTETVPAARHYAGTTIVGKPYDAVVRSSGQTINVYSGPATTNRIVATLNDTQRVTLSGRKDGGWSELATGGWVQTPYLWTDLA